MVGLHEDNMIGKKEEEMTQLTAQCRHQNAILQRDSAVHQDKEHK